MTGVEVIGCHEAESALLGALLAMTHADADDLAHQVYDEDFSDPRHRVVHAAIVAVLAEDVKPDPITVLGELRRVGAERSFTADRSAAVYLADLLTSAPAVVNAGHYARVVIEHRARRRLAEAGERLVQIAGSASLTVAREVALDEWTSVLAQLDRAGVDPGRAAL